jgi:hypothetical protein
MAMTETNPAKNRAPKDPRSPKRPRRLDHRVHNFCGIGGPRDGSEKAEEVCRRAGWKRGRSVGGGGRSADDEGGSNADEDGGRGHYGSLFTSTFC